MKFVSVSARLMHPSRCNAIAVRWVGPPGYRNFAVMFSDTHNCCFISRAVWLVEGPCTIINLQCGGSGAASAILSSVNCSIDMPDPGAKCNDCSGLRFTKTRTFSLHPSCA